MDHSGLDIGPADLPHRGRRSQELVRVIDRALPDPLVRRARAAIARIGTERMRQSYFTSFWLARGAAPEPLRQLRRQPAPWRARRAGTHARPPAAGSSRTDAHHAGRELLGGQAHRGSGLDREPGLPLARDSTLSVRTAAVRLYGMT